MKKFVSIMLVAVLALALCVGAFAAPSQQSAPSSKQQSSVVVSDKAETGDFAIAVIRDGYKFTYEGMTCYSYAGANYTVVNGQVFEVTGASVSSASTAKTAAQGGTSLKTGTALVAVLALTACFAGGAAVVTGKKA